MNNFQTQDIHESRNKSRLGSIGLYGRERANFISKALEGKSKILEIGCRDGSLSELYKGEKEIIGVDLDRKAIEIFQNKFNAKGFCLDLNNEWPFGEKEFDGVVATEVLGHLYYPEKIIGKISSSLKDGGVFAGTVPNAFSLANRIRLFFAEPNKTSLSDPTHVHHFSYKELKGILYKYFSSCEFAPLGKMSYLDKAFPGLFSFLMMFKCRK